MVGNEPRPRHHLDRQEVGGGQAFPMCLEEHRPGGTLTALGRRFDAVFAENVGDGAACYLMPQIGESCIPETPCSPGSDGLARSPH
ncbi:MAG: hypothetical protein ACYC9L_17320 [Sulfuricaulis sp.]